MSTTQLVGFGASTAQGIGDPEGGFLRRLQDLLPLEIVNRGIGGDTTAQMLARAGELEALRPYHLVVILGCNDLPRENDGTPEIRATLEEYTRNLQELLPRIKGEGTSLFVSSYPVCPRRTGIDPIALREYMEAAVAVALSCGYDVWDLYREMVVQGSDYLSADGLHFGAAGHAFIAQRVAERMRH